MALRPLYPPVKDALVPGWELLATEGGRTGRGVRATVILFNGEARYTQSLALGYPPEQTQFVAAIAGLCGIEPPVVAAILPKLAYSIEAVLREMADKHIEGDGLPGQPFTFEDLEPWPTPVDSAALLTTLADIYTRYIVLPSRGADTLALWTIHTYAGRAAGLVVLTLLPLGRVAAVGPGDFDTSFGTGGKVAAVFDPRHNDCRWVG